MRYIRGVKFVNKGIKHMRKRNLLWALSLLLFISCGNSYIDQYEDLCDEAKERIEAATSVKEVNAVVRMFREDISQLTKENAEEADKLRISSGEVDKKTIKLRERRIKAHNSVSKAAAEKRRKLKQ